MPGSAGKESLLLDEIYKGDFLDPEFRQDVENFHDPPLDRGVIDIDLNHGARMFLDPFGEGFSVHLFGSAEGFGILFAGMSGDHALGIDLEKDRGLRRNGRCGLLLTLGIRKGQRNLFGIGIAEAEEKSDESEEAHELKSLAVDVGEDGLHVFVVFQFVDEGIDFLQLCF